MSNGRVSPVTGEAHSSKKEGLRFITLRFFPHSHASDLATGKPWIEFNVGNSPIEGC